MISRFGYLYAGHVDLDDVGFAGTPVNDRWLSDEALASAFDKAADIARVMDETGFDTMWLAEHHFQREGYECIPNILMLAVHLAHLTQRIDFGCGFNVTPMWHPLRLAEDFATADILTGGRVVFGVGRGYHTREVEVFGAPMLDTDANRELFEEQVDVIMAALKERSFSHHGKHYDIPPKVSYRGYELEEITLVPKPLVRPLECWQPIVSASPRGLDFMVKHGIKGVIGGGAAVGGANEQAVLAWRDALARGGRETEPGEDLLITFSTHVAETPEKAMKEARPFFEEHMKMFAPLGFVRGLSDEHIDALDDPAKALTASLPTIEDGVAAGSWLLGQPERIVEQLQEIQERLPGLTAVNLGPVVSTSKAVTLEQLEALGRDVIPALRNASETGG